VQINKPFFLLGLFCLSLSCLHGQGNSGNAKGRDTLPRQFDSLKPAVVTAALRPRIKGDTLEYNTESILLRSHAVAEELLRRLPGLHVDMDGNITYNGGKIEHLLVDGEDIFGSDPTLVTRNFDASKVAKVQIIDRKSDQANFTKIDDGVRTKTLNLILKEEAKDGLFGKLEAGANSDGYYNGNAVLAAFHKKEQFTALGMASNTGSLEVSSPGSANGRITFINGNSDALGATAGVGIPRFTAATFHYANIWNVAEDHFTSNYQYSHYVTEPLTTTQSLQIQPGGIYNQYQQSRSTNEQDQHWVNGLYEYIPNSKYALQLSYYGVNSAGHNQFGAVANSRINDTTVNTSRRTIQDLVSKNEFSSNLSWKMRIGNSDQRTFSIGAGLNTTNNSTGGYSYSLNAFYPANGGSEIMDTVDQRIQINNHVLRIGGNLNFTEPIGAAVMLGFSYGLSVTSDRPIQATYNRGDGKYNEEVGSLSTRLQTQTVSQRITSSLQGKIGRVSYVIGNDWIGYGYRQDDLSTDSLLQLHRWNWTPSILLLYTLDPVTTFLFNFNSETKQPSPNQLQPMTNNSDPLHITFGNPDLKPALNNSMKLEFQQFKAWRIGLSLTGSLTNSSISTKTTTDSLGRQASQPVNVNGGKVASLNFSLGRKVEGFDLGFQTVSNWTQNFNYVNADLSRNNIYNAGAGISLSQYVNDMYSFQLKTNFTYFESHSSINNTTPIHYWSQNHEALLSIYLVPKFDIGTGATYTWQQKSSALAGGTSVILWNAYISRNLLHDKITVKTLLNNILGQNSAVSRTNIANVNTQSSTNILGRNWMLTVTYHFDKKFGKR
jgi:Outer membrane protein beta-barrel family